MADFLNQAFSDPKFPLALALLLGGAKRPGPSILPGLVSNAVPQSVGLAQQQEARKALEALGASGAFGEATGLPQDQAMQFAKALATGGAGMSPLLTLLANRPDRELTRAHTTLQIDKIKQDMADRESAGKVLASLFGGGDGAGGTAPTMPTGTMPAGAPTFGAASPGFGIAPERLLQIAAMPGISAGTAQSLRAMASQRHADIAAERQRSEAVSTNESVQAGYGLGFGRDPRTWTRDQWASARDRVQRDRVEVGAATAGAGARATADVKQEEPMSPADLTHYIDKYGSAPPAGSTPRDVQRGGYRAVPATIASAAPKVQGAYAVLDRLDELTGRILTEPTLAGRIRSMPEIAWQQFSQANPDIALYSSLAAGTLAPIIRSLGEVGTLAEGDVARAKALLPKLYPIPDSPEVAKRHIGDIRDIIRASSGIEPKPKGTGPNPNNVGNLRPPGASTGFQQPATREEGLAAMDANLQSYGRQGINTLNGIISKWAPPTENDTAAYIKAVAARLGIGPDQPIDLSDPAQRQAIGTAIMLQEKGVGGIFKPRAAPAAPPKVIHYDAQGNRLP